jgi:hypothetical protein
LYWHAQKKQLSKSVYTDSEFNFVNSTISSLDYNSIEKQDVIVLNELDGIPQAQTTSRSFVENGGNLIALQKRHSGKPRTVSQ